MIEIQDMKQKAPHAGDIDPKRWKEYLPEIITESLWLLGSRDRSGPHSGDYHGNFVPQIPYQVIRRFTCPEEVVLDLFSGMGTTLIECRRTGRHGIGVELQPEVARRSRERIETAENPDSVRTQVLVGDSASAATLDLVRTALRGLGTDMAHHVILHPPYWDIIKFSGDQNGADLSTCPTKDDFLRLFERVVSNATDLLMPGRYLTLVIGDKYSRGEWIPLGFDCMEICRRLGLRLKAINVKDIQGNEKGKGRTNNLWKYRALRHGFYIFKHEYVMLFLKEE
ncbi:MAG: TRM11 family SAM-dependent methyltransferase [Candidatus Xenobia bacterium]